MKPNDTERLHPAIDPTLDRLARSSPKPSWHDAWNRLGPKSTHEERVEVCRAIRDSGCLPDEAGYFLVDWAAENLAEEADARRDDPLLTLNNFEAVRASERAFAALLNRLGEVKMASLFRTDPAEHKRRREAGRSFFLGQDEEDEEADDPNWLDGLLRSVAARVVSSRSVESLAYRYRPDQFVRELHVCPIPGQNWAVDVERLREAFVRIDGCGWYAAPAGPGEAPYFWIEGEFDGQEVFLRVLQAAEAGTHDETWRRSKV